MGWFSSEEASNEEKTIDSTGHVNTNIIIQEAKDTHLQTALSEKIVYGTYILIGLELIKLAICTYSMWKKNLKRKYNSSNA